MVTDWKDIKSVSQRNIAMIKCSVLQNKISIIFHRLGMCIPWEHDSGLKGGFCEIKLFALPWIVTMNGYHAVNSNEYLNVIKELFHAGIHGNLWPLFSRVMSQAAAKQTFDEYHESLIPRSLLRGIRFIVVMKW